MLVLLTFFSLSSCTSDDSTTKDPRDQYVGTWSSVSTGSLTLFQNGLSVGTIPLNQNSTVSISKSGNNILLIDGTSYIVNGNNLNSNPTPITQNSNGVNIVASENSYGTLGSNIIILNNSVTGTWNSTNSTSGNLSGTVVTTLTR